LLSQALGRLIAVAESYPDLKASANFSQLQTSLETLEGEIQMSRRYYNGAARDLNIKVESVPSNIVANMFGFEKAEYFEIDDPADRIVPKVAFS
jgi:LemA protein